MTKLKGPRPQVTLSQRSLESPLVDPCQPPFVLTGPHSYLLPLVCACLHYFAGPLFSLVCPCLVALAGPCAHCCLFVPFATCSCLPPFMCWSSFVPTCLCPLSCPKVCHRYTMGLVYFLTDHFIALFCAIKMSPWSCQMDKYWSSYGQKKIQKKFLPTVAYNSIIFPTNTVGKKLRVKYM